MRKVYADNASFLVGSLYGSTIRHIPKEVTPEALGDFMVGSFYDKNQHGLIFPIDPNMKYKFVGGNMIAGTDGTTMMLGAPLVTAEYYEEYLGVDAEDVRDVAITCIFGVAGHEALHNYITSKLEGFYSMESHNDYQIELIKSYCQTHNIPFSKNLAYSVINMVEDVYLEQGILPNTPKFKYLIPFLSATLNVMVSKHVLEKELATVDSRFSAIQTMIIHLRSRDTEFTNRLLEVPDVMKANLILNNARTTDKDLRYQAVNELYAFFVELIEEEEDEDGGDDDEEAGMENSNDTGDDTDSSGDGSGGDSDADGDDDLGDSGQGDSESDEDGELNEGDDNGEQEDSDDDSQDGQENGGGISQEAKEELEQQTGIPNIGSNPQPQNSEMDSSVRDEGEVGEVSEQLQSALDQASEILQEIQKELDQNPELKDEFEKWVNQTVKTQQYDDNMYLARGEDMGSVTGRGLKVAYLEKLQELAEMFRYSKFEDNTVSSYEEEGDLLGHSLDAIFDLTPFDNETVKGDGFGKMKIAICIDLSGSTRGSGNNNNPKGGLTNIMCNDLMSAGFSMYQILSENGFPVVVYGHTVSGSSPHIYEIATNEIPFRENGHIETTPFDKVEENFNKTLQNAGYGTNADGSIIEHAIRALKQSEFRGDNAVFMLSDGMPSNCPYGSPDEYLDNAIKTAREDNTKVIAMAIDGGVVDNLKHYYGEEFTCDISGEDCGEQIFGMMMNMIEAS